MWRDLAAFGQVFCGYRSTRPSLPIPGSPLPGGTHPPPQVLDVDGVGAVASPAGYSGYHGTLVPNRPKPRLTALLSERSGNSIRNIGFRTVSALPGSIWVAAGPGVMHGFTGGTRSWTLRQGRFGALASILLLAAIAPSFAYQARNSSIGYFKGYSYQQWNLRNGLPQISITSLLQTRDGYFWMGSNGGLIRYDGAQFKVFDTSNSALESIRIRALWRVRTEVFGSAPRAAGSASIETAIFIRIAWPRASRRTTSTAWPWMPAGLCGPVATRGSFGMKPGGSRSSIKGKGFGSGMSPL